MTLFRDGINILIENFKLLDNFQNIKKIPNLQKFSRFLKNVKKSSKVYEKIFFAGGTILASWEKGT